MKVVTYYCSGCKKEVIRVMSVARKLHKSWCEQSGRDVAMTRRRWRRATNAEKRS